MALKENIQALISLENINQKILAQQTGIAEATISQWMNARGERRGKRRGARIETVQIIADRYGYTLDDLTSDTHGLANQRGRRIIPVPAYTYARVVGHIAAGSEREAIESSEEMHWVNPDIQDAHPDVFYLIVSGDSMDKVVHDGAYALIVPLRDPESELTEDDVAAVLVNGDDATLKHVKFTPEGVFLKPDSTNPQHKNRFLAADDPEAPYFKVLGVMVEAITPIGHRR